MHCYHEIETLKRCGKQRTFCSCKCNGKRCTFVSVLARPEYEGVSRVRGWGGEDKVSKGGRGRRRGRTLHKSRSTTSHSSTSSHARSNSLSIGPSRPTPFPRRDRFAPAEGCAAPYEGEEVKGDWGVIEDVEGDFARSEGVERDCGEVDEGKREARRGKGRGAAVGGRVVERGEGKGNTQSFSRTRLC